MITHIQPSIALLGLFILGFHSSIDCLFLLLSVARHYTIISDSFVFWGLWRSNREVVPGIWGFLMFSCRPKPIHIHVAGKVG